jgi:hypothetical protein
MRPRTPHPRGPHATRVSRHRPLGAACAPDPDIAQKQSAWENEVRRIRRIKSSDLRELSARGRERGECPRKRGVTQIGVWTKLGIDTNTRGLTSSPGGIHPSDDHTIHENAGTPIQNLTAEYSGQHSSALVGHSVSTPLSFALTSARLDDMVVTDQTSRTRSRPRRAVSCAVGTSTNGEAARSSWCTAYTDQAIYGESR